MFATPIRKPTILGGGTAGLIAALTLRKPLPQLELRIIRSAEIGGIDVGEGTTFTIPEHQFSNLRLPPAQGLTVASRLASIRNSAWQ